MLPSFKHVAVIAGTLLIAGSLAACGSKGSSGTAAPATAASGGGCAGVKDSTIVVLTDDKHLQNSDNIVPAVNKNANNPALLAALDAVSGTLSQDKLVALNKSVDIDHKTPQAAANDYATAAGFTTGLAKGPGGKIIIGAANFSENQEVAYLYQLALKAAGYDASVKTIGNRELYLPELEKNHIQIVPEYAATLTNTLNAAQNGKDAPVAESPDIDKTMTALTGLGTKANLVFGKPAAATDQNAFAVTKATATKYGLTSLSDFAAKCSGALSTLAGPAECPQRPFCQAGLKSLYGIDFGQFKSTDAGGPLTKTALTNGDVTMGLVFSSDSSIGS
jgi:osmoprotectant transport system substrate-binding protein